MTQLHGSGTCVRTLESFAQTAPHSLGTEARDIIAATGELLEMAGAHLGEQRVGRNEDGHDL